MDTLFNYSPTIGANETRLRASCPSARKMSAAECQKVTRWARRHAPELLHILQVAYLTGQNMALSMRTIVYNRIVTPGGDHTTTSRPGPCPTLEGQEREHIQRVLKEARSYKAAADELGIDGSTLWRKRKRYNLA